MQKVVRTVPEGKYKCPEDELEKHLKNGWKVVMVNKFDICSSYNGNPLGIQGNEYILEMNDI